VAEDDAVFKALADPTRRALMDRLDYQHDLPSRFSHGVQSLNDFEVAEELAWVLVPSGFIFGE